MVNAFCECLVNSEGLGNGPTFKTDRVSDNLNKKKVQENVSCEKLGRNGVISARIRVKYQTTNNFYHNSFKFKKLFLMK